MLGHAPEISDTLEWMLQSRQVGEETLVRTLVQEKYAFVYRFISSIIESKDASRCQAITEQIISSAVKDPTSYRGDMDVETWLSRRAIAILREHKESPWEKPQEDMHLEDIPELGENRREIIRWYATLNCKQRVLVTLVYLFEFSLSQVAAVLDLRQDAVEEMLQEVRGSLPRSHNEPHAEKVDELDIQRSLAAFWPGVELDGESEAAVARRILDDLHEKDQRKRNMVYFGEAVLAIFAIVFAFSLGGLIGWFTPQPTPEIIHETRMVEQIIFVSPTPGPTPTARPFPEKAVIYEAVGGETLYNIADKIYFNGQILSALNDIPVDQPLVAGQLIMIGISESKVIMPTMPGDISTPQAPLPTPEALSADSSPAEIRKRIKNANSYWQTLWADALVIQYGPPGYIGEPDFKRQQIWIDQPYFHYLLDGRNGGLVEYAYSVVGGWENLLNVQTGDLLSNVGPQELNFQPELKQMLFQNEIAADFQGEIEVIDEDVVAERPALVLNWYLDQELAPGSGMVNQPQRVLQGRYWIDKHLGSVLRVQKFSGNFPDQAFVEVIISKLAINVTMPRRLYDRSQYLQTYFSKDHTGDFVHEPIEIPDDILLPRQVLGNNVYQPPPPDMEIAQSQLDFHWTSLKRFDPEQGTKVDLFANGYYLGSVEFAEPEQLMCARSPDGGKIAFSSWSSELDFGYTPLGWLDISQVPQVHQFDPELIPYDFAFSNDSQQLAIYACQRYGDQVCGVYIVELESGDSRLLRAVEQGAALMWSPDNKAIAIQGSFLKEGKWRLLVLDTRTGAAIHEGPFDWEGLWVAHDSPVHDWGLQYPPLRGGLALCKLPPGID